MDDGGFVDPAEAHKRLDGAVADCYGWPADVAQDLPALSRLLEDLNREISGGARTYQPAWEGPEEEQLPIT